MLPLTSMNKQSAKPPANIPAKSTVSGPSNSSDVTRIKIGNNYVDLTVDVDSDLEDLLDEEEDLEEEERDEDFNLIIAQGLDETYILLIFSAFFIIYASFSFL